MTNISYSKDGQMVTPKKWSDLVVFDTGDDKRLINNLVIHCTATPRSTSIDSIKRYWKVNKNWRMPGYHGIIKPDGELVELASFEDEANGVRGHNSDSLHIAWLGGIDNENKPIDNRTDEQKTMLYRFITGFLKKYPKAKVLGHRDFVGVKKSCPCFDVTFWMEQEGIK